MSSLPWPDPAELRIFQLGEPLVSSPLRHCRFVPDRVRVPLEIELEDGALPTCRHFFEKAGPRERLFFEPSRTKAAIVTCGGLCPGLNNVIRSLFLQLHHHYGLPEVYGIRHGYAGLNPELGLPPVRLSTDMVESIHKQGGTILGSSRGPQEPAVTVDFLARQGIQVLFTVGGDGTQRGAQKIHDEAVRRGYPLAVVGIPKTIDNDIAFVWRTFGYFTALEKAREVIDSAHNEARSAVNGVALVKLMGREAGFIAAGAALASGDVNIVLVPEVDFDLDGEDGLLAHLRRRLEARGHAVIVVAEGAGQRHAGVSDSFDVSGNRKFHDIGPFLRDKIVEYFRELKRPATVRYIDPSYHIRSVPANVEDALLCDQLARNAAHAALAGKSGLLIGEWYNVAVHVPLSVVTARRKLLREDSAAWSAVLAGTGQPARLTNAAAAGQ